MSMFQYEWLDDVEPSADRIAQHTMARISISVGGQVVTSVYDRYLKDYRDHLFVPLAHIAEWLAVNWWHLWYESANVSGEQRPGFLSRHDLAHAGNGFVLPRLIFTPMGGQIHVAARRWNPRYAPLEFRTECFVMVGRDELEQEFRSLVDEVIARLRAKRTSFETLESEWRAIKSLDSDEREFCRAAALMGLDPFDIDEQTADHIARVWNQTDPAIRDEAFGAAQEDSLEAIQQWIDRSLESAEQGQSGADWRMVRKAVRAGSVRESLPWWRGHHDARAVRGELDAAPGKFAFEEAGPRAIWSQVAPSPVPRIHGCVASDSPSCVMVSRPEPGRRFLLARALGDYIGREQPGPAILGTLDTARQAQSRAFAAEFLAPAEWIRKQAGSTVTIDGRSVNEFANELGVSSWVIRYQIHNHRIVDIATPYSHPVDWQVKYGVHYELKNEDRWTETSTPRKALDYPLRGSGYRYDRPYDSVAEHEWSAGK